MVAIRIYEEDPQDSCAVTQLTKGLKSCEANLDLNLYMKPSQRVVTQRDLTGSGLLILIDIVSGVSTVIDLLGYSKEKPKLFSPEVGYFVIRARNKRRLPHCSNIGVNLISESTLLTLEEFIKRKIEIKLDGLCHKQ